MKDFTEKRKNLQAQAQKSLNIKKAQTRLEKKMRWWKVLLFVIFSIVMFAFFYQSFSFSYNIRCPTPPCYTCGQYGCVSSRDIALIYSIIGLIVLYTSFLLIKLAYNVTKRFYNTLRGRMEAKKVAEKFSWTKFLKKNWLLAVIIGLVLFGGYYAYKTIPVFTYSSSIRDLEELPDGETEYYGTVEYSSYSKAGPVTVICGDCFGIGKPYENKMRTGECCYGLHPEPEERYQNAKIIATIPKDVILHSSPSRELFFSVKDTTVLKDLTPEDCKNRNYVSHCYYELAKRLSNIDLCEMSDSKEACISEAAKSVEECEKITSEYTKEYCYVNLAIKSGDSNLCEKDERRADWCKQEVYKSLARKLNDLNLCNKLEDEYSKETCGTVQNVSDELEI